MRDDLAKILVAEDNDDTFELMRVALGAGRAVIRAKTGSEAIALAQHENPDLVLMDLMLPEIDGLEVVRFLRNVKGLDSIPIIAVTALASEEYERRAFDAGCDDFIAKPFPPDALSKCVAAFLAGGDVRRANVPRILIAEDDPDSRALLEEELTRAGYRTYSAKNGRAALDVFQNEHPDLVLLDVMMPEIGGYDVCRRIKSFSGNFVPVIFLTALSDDADKLKGLETGADEYVVKPWSREVLMARIRSLLRIKRLQDTLKRRNWELHRKTEELRFALADRDAAPNDRAVNPDEVPTFDALTGLYTYARLHEILERETATAGRYRSNLSVIAVKLIGVDELNRRFGAIRVDAAIRETAAKIREGLRAEDFAGRYSGTLFLIVAPGVGEGQVGPLARTVTARAFARIVAPTGEEKILATAFGVATLGTDLSSGDALIRAAIRNAGPTAT